VAFLDRAGNCCHPHRTCPGAGHFDFSARIDLVRLCGECAGQSDKRDDRNALNFHLLVSSSVKAKKLGKFLTAATRSASMFWSCCVTAGKATPTMQKMLRRRKLEWFAMPITAVNPVHRIGARVPGNSPRCGIAGEPVRLGGCTVSPARP
jgi:hypothetical protein